MVHTYVSWVHFKRLDSQEVTITITRILSKHNIDPYNTKLISSCLQQKPTLTMWPVTPTGTGALTPEEADRAEEALAVGAVTETITESQLQNIHLKGKRKDGPLSKLTITKGGQHATQYKKIIDVLQVFCADKGYKFIYNAIWTNFKLVQAFLADLSKRNIMVEYISCTNPDC